jgi:hypothetical protein
MIIPNPRYEISNFYVPEKRMLQYKFQVVYRFKTMTMLLEPLLMSGVLFFV